MFGCVDPWWANWLLSIPHWKILYCCYHWYVSLIYLLLVSSLMRRIYMLLMLHLENLMRSILVMKIWHRLRGSIFYASNGSLLELWFPMSSWLLLLWSVFLHFFINALLTVRINICCYHYDMVDVGLYSICC